MGSLCLLLPLSFSTSSLLPKLHHQHRHQPTPKPQLAHREVSFIVKLPTARFCRKGVVIKSNANESQFVDEDGVIEDMDGYMNHLSLEYDSVWDTKPSWCQPWTIALTGVLVTALSWIILHSVVITAVILSLICAWWYIFLYSYPKAYTEMIAERRKKVNSGVEDTFGITKN